MATSRKLNKRKIKLSLPGYFKKESKLKSIDALENECRELRHFSIQVLTQISSYLHDFNRTKIISARRFDLIERCILLAVPLINTIFSQYHKSHPLPEDDEKRELIIMASNVCTEITLAYMRLFEHDINLSILRYNRSRERISNCGHRIVEFIYAEQRLRTLRYQDLTADVWRNLNSVFSVLYCFEDIQFQQATLGILHLSATTSQRTSQKSKKNNKGSEKANSRIVSVYISIQLNGVVDMFSMATQQSHIAATKIRQYAGVLTVSENLDESVPENHILTHSNNSGAAGFSSLDSDAMEFSIDVTQFKKNIQEEFDKTEVLLLGSNELHKEEIDVDHESNAPATIANQEDVELHISLAVILKKLGLHVRVEERAYIGHVDPLFIFNGFKICFNIMSDLRKKSENAANNQEKEDTQDMVIRDMLSQRSATIADDNTKEESSKWLVSNSSDQGILAETRESRFTHSMFVGQLVLYGSGEISPGEFNLAYLSRMHRDAGDKLQVALVNISKKAELVVAQTKQLKKSALGLPGLLLADYDDGLGLVLHTGHRLQTGVFITLSRDKKSYDYNVGKVLMIQREFTLYQLVTV